MSLNPKLDATFKASRSPNNRPKKNSKSTISKCFNQFMYRFIYDNTIFVVMGVGPVELLLETLRNFESNPCVKQI